MYDEFLLNICTQFLLTKHTSAENARWFLTIFLSVILMALEVLDPKQYPEPAAPAKKRKTGINKYVMLLIFTNISINYIIENLRNEFSHFCQYEPSFP